MTPQPHPGTARRAKNEFARNAYKDEIRARLGIDKNYIEQWLSWVGNASRATRRYPCGWRPIGPERSNASHEPRTGRAGYGGLADHRTPGGHHFGSETGLSGRLRCPEFGHRDARYPAVLLATIVILWHRVGSILVPVLFRKGVGTTDGEP